MTSASITDRPAGAGPDDILSIARVQVLDEGKGLSQEQVLTVLQLPDERLEELLALAHDVRMRWCGPRSRSRASSR